MRLAEVVAASRAVAGTAARLEKIRHLVDLLTRVPPDEIGMVIAFLSGEPRQGRMKVGAALLSWQTKKLLELEIGRDDDTVHVRPEVVVEIAFNDVQASPQYPGGFALRFARVKRYRTDKTAAEADTFAAIESMYRGQTPADRR